MALPRPTGTATIMAITVIQRVPTRSVRRSYTPCRGYHPSENQTLLQSTSVTKVHVSLASDQMIAALMRMETVAAAVRTHLMIRSVRTRRLSPRRSLRVRPCGGTETSDIGGLLGLGARGAGLPGGAGGVQLVGRE